MATAAQNNANRANAQFSTGPTSAEGLAISSRNAVRHGLSARETALFFNDPDEQKRFEDHKRQILEDLLPIGAIEEKLVHLYAFSLFQAERSQFFEILCQEEWMLDRSNPKLLANMERMTRYGELHERRAARNLNELRKLQLDRYAAEEVEQNIAAQQESVMISRALPLAKIRKSDFYKTNPKHVAENIIAADPAVQERPPVDLATLPKVDWFALHAEFMAQQANEDPAVQQRNAVGLDTVPKVDSSAFANLDLAGFAATLKNL